MELPLQAFFGIHHQLFEVTGVAHLLFFPHLAAAPSRALFLRCSGVSIASPLGTFFFPPNRPSATAAGFFRFAMCLHHTTTAYRRPRFHSYAVTAYCI